jgi:hypothetical protein
MKLDWFVIVASILIATNHRAGDPGRILCAGFVAIGAGHGDS